VAGAGGIGGVGAVEIPLRHPQARPAALVDVTDIGTPVSGLYPHLAGYCDMPLLDGKDPKAPEKVDAVSRPPQAAPRRDRQQAHDRGQPR